MYQTVDLRRIDKGRIDISFSVHISEWHSYYNHIKGAWSVHSLNEDYVYLRPLKLNLYLVLVSNLYLTLFNTSRNLLFFEDKKCFSGHTKNKTKNRKKYGIRTLMVEKLRRKKKVCVTATGHV